MINRIMRSLYKLSNTFFFKYNVRNTNSNKTLSRLEIKRYQNNKNQIKK